MLIEMHRRRGKKFDSFMIFDNVLQCGDDKVYGILYSSKKFPPSRGYFADFVEYLCGARKWVEVCGNAVVKEDKSWIDKSSEVEVIYNLQDDYVKEFCRKAYEENPIHYRYKEGVKLDYKKEDLCGSYILSRELWERLKKMLDD